MPVVGPYATEQPLTQSKRGRIYIMFLLNFKDSVEFNIIYNSYSNESSLY